jgi:lipopolysaccharide transport system permease protein
MLRGSWRYRSLLTSLMRRQYQLRYRQSFVGFAWAILPPLITIGVGALLFRGVLGVETGGTRYEIFAMAGLIPWTFFANSLTQGVPSVVGSMQMVTRLSFPRSVIPLSVVGVSLLDLAVTAVGFVMIAYATGAGVPLTALWAPLLLLAELPLVMGIVLLGSALNVFARDIRLAVPIVVQFWLLLTPVMYPLTQVPANLRSIYIANPMTGIVESFRSVLVFGQSPDPGVLTVSVLGGVVLLAWGTWYFGVTEHRFADVV